MQIVNFIKDSFQDCLPFKHALTLFSYGCNLKCKMCEGYNYETVTNKENIIGNAIDIIKENITPLHDCVVFLGGEPTIHGKKLIDALRYCKSIGLKTKVFTNGVLSDTIENINNLKLCDAWSVDYKGISENIAPYIGIGSKEYLINIKKTLNNIIKYNQLPLEIRTTYFDNNINDRDIICERMKHLKSSIDKIYPNYPYFKYIEQKDVR